jgi:ribose 5-phosphate isomerase B
MRIAVASDELYPVNTHVCSLLQGLGHEVVRFGALVDGQEAPWAEVAEQAAACVARGECDEGILFCWTGTGICMAANKLAGIRAALCAEPAVVRAARIWNHANVLCLSNRSLSNDVAKEMIHAWLETSPTEQGADGVRRLREVEARHRGAQGSGRAAGDRSERDGAVCANALASASELQ